MYEARLDHLCDVAIPDSVFVGKKAVQDAHNQTLRKKLAMFTVDEYVLNTIHLIYILICLLIFADKFRFLATKASGGMARSLAMLGAQFTVTRLARV